MAALESRVRVLEDEVAIHRLINQWGPAVDTGESGAAARLWTDDGVLESDLSRLEGPAAVEAMVESDGQQDLIRSGCAHVQAFPVIAISGDTATATGYSRVYRYRDGGHEIWRVSANHWELRRTDAGWRVAHRTNRVIDGGPQAHAVLRRALEER